MNLYAWPHRISEDSHASWQVTDLFGQPGNGTVQVNPFLLKGNKMDDFILIFAAIVVLSPVLCLALLCWALNSVKPW